MSANGRVAAERFDVIIAGGGPAGAAAALALVGGDPSLRVAVVAGRAGRSGNGETLTSNALPLLEQLGVTRAQRRHRLEAGRWRTLYDGVYCIAGSPQT